MTSSDLGIMHGLIFGASRLLTGDNLQPFTLEKVSHHRRCLTNRQAPSRPRGLFPGGADRKEYFFKV